MEESKIYSLREKSQNLLILGYFIIGGSDFDASIKKNLLKNFCSLYLL